MAQPTHQDVFMREVERLRADYERQRETTNLVPPTGNPVYDLALDFVDGIVYHTYWYEIPDSNSSSSSSNPSQKGEDLGLKNRLQVIRLADIAGTLSGEILRLRRNIPDLDKTNDYEIVGDDIRQLESAPPLPADRDDSENTGELLNSLPTVEVDPDVHFVKKGKYPSEIHNLLACQGGSCPGVPKSAHIIQLLGKSSRDELVFRKYNPRYVLALVHQLATYKRWILQVIDGLRCLHSLGIVHRDLRIDNLVFSPDNTEAVIIDLESRWGNRLAPEIARQPVLDAGWSQKSDIYDLGYLIKGMIYGNAPITNLVEWPVPHPLDAVVKACTNALPEKRPTLDELAAMMDKIE